MKKTLITLIMILHFVGLSPGQDNSITLNLCYEKALENYPLAKQMELLPASNVLKLQNLNKNYLPHLMLNGQVHYQSDVTKTPFQDVSIPGLDMPTVEKDWYKITLDANQLLYDGGLTNKQKDFEIANLEIDKQNIEIELYKLKEKINQVYFSILQLKENKHILELHKENLSSKLKIVESGVRNGTHLSTNADILKAEIIKMEQAIYEIDISKDASISILKEFTCLPINENTQLIAPEVFVDFSNYENKRLEYSLFSLYQNKIEASKKMIGAKNLPRFSAFGQAGYGRPGYDMLKNEFDDFYMVGARLNWNFWDWNHSRNEKEILDLQNEIINTQKETFDINLKTQIENIIAEIKKIDNMISRDLEIIELRIKISNSSSSQLDNGIITSTDYLTELNAESKAKLDLEVHKIQLIKAKLDYQAAIGDL